VNGQVGGKKHYPALWVGFIIRVIDLQGAIEIKRLIFPDADILATPLTITGNLLPICVIMLIAITLQWPDGRNR
jgi:hypothetical protein